MQRLWASNGRMALITGTIALAAFVVPQPVSSHPSRVTDADDAALAFNPDGYTTITVTVDGKPTTVRRYSEICDVAKPVEAAAQQPGMGGTTTISNTRCGYQSMNVFVPETAAQDQRAPIYFAVNNSGWMASYIRASITDGGAYNSATSVAGAALEAGYVFVDVANRSRGMVGAAGDWPGKAPAAVVDAKAAVRYLRLNDAKMPGSAERIIVNGTSGGGALASILGAAGNSPDYLPYLARIGAAGITADGRSTIRDDVFAINAYCPITDLGHADLSYEWLYNVLGTRTELGQNNLPAAASAIAAQFPAYERSLGLGLDATNLLDVIKGEVIRSAETYLKADPANTIPPLGGTFVIVSGGPPGQPPTTKSYVNDWIDVNAATGKVRFVDMKKYLAFVATQAALKTTPAFDALGVDGKVTSRAETDLFGPADQRYLNYTAYRWDHNDVAGDGSGLDDTGLTRAQYIRKSSTTVDDQVRLIDPMSFIGTPADTAPYWYVRAGTRDRDTSFIVPINLSRALAADRQVNSVNFRLAWNQPHAGNYDVPEAMAWIADVVARAGDPLVR
ncbi:subtype B tannase [Actinoplanes sp. NPDC020271]|uniref:subtype B tannase n=1 Tax=Actinoplanes sp. NPDC020271 TaxID=3363896 RepID=UPI003789AC02